MINNLYRTISAVALLVLFSAAAYSHTWNNELVWDDLHLREFTKAKVAQGGLSSLLSSRMLEVAGGDMKIDFYRPVFLASFMLDSIITENLLFSYHITNILLHILATLILFWFFSQLALSKEVALLGALVFAAHPIHTESVAFVSGRTDVLASIFTFASAALWASCRNRDRAPRVWMIILSTILIFFGSLSKEVAFMLPLAIVLVDFIERYGEKGWRTGWLNRTGVFVVPWTCVSCLVLLLRWSILGMKGAFDNFYNSALAGVLLDPWIVPEMWLTYLRLLVVPLKQNHWYLTSHLKITPLTVIVLLLYFLAGLYCHISNKLRVFFIGTVWVAVFLAPVSGIVPLSGAIIAERYLYLPSAGFALVLGTLLCDAIRVRKIRFAALVAFFSFLLLMTAEAYHQSVVWTNSETLFENMIQTSPEHYMGYYELALVQVSKNNYSQAEDYARKAVARNPSFSKGYNLLGQILEERGEFSEALLFLKRGAWWSPSFLPTFLNLGKLEAILGYWEDAANDLQRGLQFAEDDTDALYRLGISYLRLGRGDLASMALCTAIRLDPYNPSARFQLGSAYLLMGRTELAQQQLEILKGQDSRMAVQLTRLIENNKLRDDGSKP